jgi:hypothetical protein
VIAEAMPLIVSRSSISQAHHPGRNADNLRWADPTEHA